MRKLFFQLFLLDIFSALLSIYKTYYNRKEIGLSRENEQLNNEKDENIEIEVGDLVIATEDTYGIKEECLLPENFNKTIMPWDNVAIEKDTPGLVVRVMGYWHTRMLVICWGNSSGNSRNLVLSENKIKKLNDFKGKS